MSTPLTLDDLIEALRDAQATHATNPRHADKDHAGALRFRFAVPYGDYAASTFADVDPFGPVVGVIVALDGSTYIDIVPELIDDKQGVLL